MKKARALSRGKGIAAFIIMAVSSPGWGADVPMEDQGLSLNNPVAAAGVSPEQAVLPPELQTVEQLNGTETELPYRLRAGSVDRSVVLSSNPTTGYAWQVISEGNTKCARVELIDRPRKKASTALIGAPGQTVVKIYALRPGTSRVVLAYCRAWEKDTKPARRITLKITVISSK